MYDVLYKRSPTTRRDGGDGPRERFTDNKKKNNKRRVCYNVFRSIKKKKKPRTSRISDIIMDNDGESGPSSRRGGVGRRRSSMTRGTLENALIDDDVRFSVRRRRAEEKGSACARAREPNTYGEKNGIRVGSEVLSRTCVQMPWPRYTCCRRIFRS